MRFTTSALVGLAALAPFGFARNDGNRDGSHDGRSLKNGVAKDSGLDPNILSNIQAGTELPGEKHEEGQGASLDTGVFGEQESEWDPSSNGDSAPISGITGDVESSDSIEGSIEASIEGGYGGTELNDGWKGGQDGSLDTDNFEKQELGWDRSSDMPNGASVRNSGVTDNVASSYSFQAANNGGYGGAELNGAWNKNKEGLDASLDKYFLGNGVPEWDHFSAISNGVSAWTYGVTGNVGSSHSFQASTQASDKGDGLKRILQSSTDCTTTCISQRPVVDVSGSDFQALIASCIEGSCIYEGPLNCWDTSKVTDMTDAFVNQEKFKASLECWDTSSVTSMSRMFSIAESFNQPIGTWNVSSVTDMSSMFAADFMGSSAFNQNINEWDVSSVTSMSIMFYGAIAFNQPLDEWDVSSVRNMVSMISRASAFNQPIGDWDVSSVIDMSAMFRNAYAFNQPIDEWNVSSVREMMGMFYYTGFNQPIGSWDVSGMEDMGLLAGAYAFNQNINEWDVSSVTSMSFMFYGASAFNQPVDEWNVSSVKDMSYMFSSASDFNQPVDEWNVSSVTTMYNMFNGLDDFNQNINEWDVSSVRFMSGMFQFTPSFDQPLDEWDVSSVRSMIDMFYYASAFNQPLDEWDVSIMKQMSNMFKGADSFDQCLSTWASKTPSKVLVVKMFAYSGCPDTTDPMPSQGPWCQTSAESCFANSGPTDPSCSNKEGFKSKGETIICDQLENFSSKNKKKQCKKKKAKKACPGVCNPRCTCEEKPTFRIKNNDDNNFKGKFKCKNVGKDYKKPSCDTVVNKKGKLVKEYCVSKCDFCF